MTTRILAAAGLLLLSGLPCLTARAQTTSVTTTTTTTTRHAPRPPSHKPVATKPVATKPVATKPVATRPAPARPAHVPVLLPHRAGPPRHATAAARRPVVRPATKKEPAVVPAPATTEAAPGKPAAPPVPADVGTNTGLHLPRYASLKSDDVNMRVGPAERYPVTWTYKRRELPVRIEREFDIWRLVEDMDGVKGWVHQATLTGRRTFVITGTEERTLRAEASATAEPVAVLKPGVVGRIRSCEAGKAWCQVQVQDYRGWLQRGDMWGVDADEVVAP